MAVAGELTSTGPHDKRPPASAARVCESDGDLNLADNVRVRLHLRNCPCCGNFVRQLEMMRKAMRRLGSLPG